MTVDFAHWLAELPKTWPTTSTLPDTHVGFQVIDATALQRVLQEMQVTADRQRCCNFHAQCHTHQSSMHLTSPIHTAVYPDRACILRNLWLHAQGHSDVKDCSQSQERRPRQYREAVTSWLFWQIYILRRKEKATAFQVYCSEVSCSRPVNSSLIRRTICAASAWGPVCSQGTQHGISI